MPRPWSVVHTSGEGLYLGLHLGSGTLHTMKLGSWLQAGWPVLLLRVPHPTPHLLTLGLTGPISQPARLPWTLQWKSSHLSFLWALVSPSSGQLP